MRKLLGVLGLMGVLVACSSSSTEGTAPGGCKDIAGNWSVTSTKTSGNCPPSGDGSPQNFTMRRDGDSWTLVYPGVTGGCAGDFDEATCKFVSNCDVTKNGQVVGSFGIEWTFSGDTLSGSEIARILPPAVQTSCTDSYSDTGQKL